jgi:hypothetical protein
MFVPLKYLGISAQIIVCRRKKLYPTKIFAVDAKIRADRYENEN